MPGSKRKRVRRKLGDVVAIPLGDGKFAFGRVLPEPLIAFYDLQTSEIPPIAEVVRRPVLFVVWVMNRAVTAGIWPVVGNIPLEDALLVDRLFSKQDDISGRLTTYRSGTGEETPATLKECEGLEAAAVWDAEHIVDRLNDHFAGRANKWVESLRPKVKK